MDTTFSTNRKFKKVFANILSIFVILAMAFPVTGNVFAEDEAPYLRAFPDQDSVDGSRWPAEQSVSLTINGMLFDPQVSDVDGYVTFDLAGYDLKRGDTLTMSSQGVSDVVYTARQLIVDNIDLDAQTIFGTVDGQQQVHVWVGEADEYLDTNGDGSWTANFSGYDDVLYPGVCGNAEAWDASEEQTSDSSTIIDWCVPPWRDEFDGQLANGWEWMNENPAKHEFTDGFLRIYASPYGVDGPQANKLMRNVTQHDFAIETHVFFEPQTNFQFAGLTIYQNNDNVLSFGRAFCDTPDVCVGNGIYFDYVQGGDWGNNFATSVDNSNEAYLRLERRDDMVRALYSYEGTTWFEIGTHWIPDDFQVNGVGLLAVGDYDKSDEDIPADFDYFEMTEGWGFLPEGFHDYDSGDVPNWACNAGGWAADPDDRAADLAIEVDIDGTALPEWLYASEYREDLDNAGVCDDGNCAFSTSLWDKVAIYEPHSVVVYAQDIPFGEWVRLSNSPKDLTCRTYDIYMFDPATGTTKQITNLPDTHEYNPRWSPDGKKIVHDVWNIDWSSHGIYITDVNTGVSTPLAGAESGSYPTWSPSGKWIAFDRGADNDYRVFIVPPTGGVPRLVREDAFMASWAPNGNRLAFQQPSDGSIRTVTLDGDSETIVAEYGNGPAWSPDGEWIAFEVDGDIWKVRVNNGGNPFGDPIQLTSGHLWEGRPTWSFNSKTIAFHAGIGDDTDIWTIPAAGGEATWLTGAPNFGDYDANYSIKGNSTTVSYSSFSPDGQAARSWVAAYTYDPPSGTFGEGTHPYHFDFEWSAPEPGSWSGQGGDFVISDNAGIYGGYVLLRGPAELQGINYPDGLTCEEAGDLNPSQPTRFLVGWLAETGESAYPEARAHFDSINATAIWDDESGELARHEILPFNEGDWFNYVCTFTEAPPKMDLRVNYGHDWVESFYEAGHAVSIQVTDSDGNVKATAELMTEPKDYWGGETGFQSMDSVWFDGDGNQMENPPDIQPYDWVYAQVDNGASAKVQIGEISGKIGLQTDSISGTILADWFADPVQVECLDWGSGQEMPYDNKDGGSVTTNGADPYSCSWYGEWDIQPGQTVGVGYLGADGHWVANAFDAPNPRIVASESGDWFWMTEFYPVMLDLFIYESADQNATLLWSGTLEAADLWGITFAGYDVHEQNLVEGNYVVVSDGVNTKGVVLEPISVTSFDTINDVMIGFASPGSEVWAAAGPMEWQARIMVVADPSGNWSADFKTYVPDDTDLPLGFDITEDMRPWSYAHIYDGDGDANEGNTPPSPEIRAWLGNQRVEGYQWPVNDWVSIEISDPNSSDIFSDSQQVIDNEWGSFVGFNLDGWELQPGQVITMTGSMTVKSHEILPVSITSVDTEQSVVKGTASSEGGIILCIYDGGCEPPMEIFADTSGNWSVDYGEELNILPGFGMDATEFDGDGDGTSFDYWVPQTTFLRPSCGDTYIVQADIPLELRYGSWVAIGEDLAIQNAEHLKVEMVLNGETVTGAQQPVVPRSEIPCGLPLEDAYGVFYVTQVDPLSPGTYAAEVTWSFDEPVTDGYDADGDGEPDWYGPGEVATQEFTIIVP